jgi:hypothetical protein
MVKTNVTNNLARSRNINLLISNELSVLREICALCAEVNRSREA